MLVSLSPTKAASTLIMYGYNEITLELRDSQDQNSLSLCQLSFLEWGREGVVPSSPYSANKCRIYEWPQSITMHINNDLRPKIDDASLTLILPWAYPQYVIIYFGIEYH